MELGVGVLFAIIFGVMVSIWRGLEEKIAKKRRENQENGDTQKQKWDR